MKPILFNYDMVRAILDGQKTVTRRVVKTKNVEITGRPKWGVDTGHKYWFDVCINKKTATTIQIAPPFHPGDILYVRETWMQIRPEVDGRTGCFMYRADYRDERLNIVNGIYTWHPSIHMPKIAARLFLRVKSVRAECLKDIDAEQANAEGIRCVDLGDGDVGYSVGIWDKTTFDDPAGAFANLWDSTIKPSELDKYGWNASPWVWVIEFEKCEKPKEENL